MELGSDEVRLWFREREFLGYVSSFQGLGRKAAPLTKALVQPLPL